MKVSRKIAARLAVPALALMAACNQETRMTVSVQNMTMMADTEIATLWISTTPGEPGDPFWVTPDGGTRRQFPIQIGVFLSSTVSHLTVVVEAKDADGKTLGKGQTDVYLGPQVVFNLFLCKDGLCPMDGCPVADAQGHLPDGGAAEAGPPPTDCERFCTLVMQAGCPPDLFSTSLESCEAACTIDRAKLDLTCRTMTLASQDTASRCAAASVRDLSCSASETSPCDIYCFLGTTLCPASFVSEASCNDKCPDTDVTCLAPQLGQALLNRSYCAQAAPQNQCGICN